MCVVGEFGAGGLRWTCLLALKRLRNDGDAALRTRAETNNARLGEGCCGRMGGSVTHVRCCAVCQGDEFAKWLCRRAV